MFFLWAKFFEWMNIFQATSFYVRLVIETIDDVYPFLSLYFISLFWFGSTLWILQINTISEEDDIEAVGYSPSPGTRQNSANKAKRRATVVYDKKLEEEKHRVATEGQKAN